eukprot:TRINITY_DN23912_c1_g1_i2.p1 TRINITY_DN23912_c1_g1~~TRINITY_DN23912_c1_g1_i2.p1  ORF type:complete len:183 (+),score=28.89 TRINITY_DN23912_c1_g1_i2:39-551(+)
MENSFSVVPSIDSFRVTREDAEFSRYDVRAFNQELGFDTSFGWGEDSLPLGCEKDFALNSESDREGKDFDSEATFRSSQLTFRSHPADRPVDTQNERHCLSSGNVVATVACNHRIPRVSNTDRRPEVLDDGQQSNTSTKKESYAARMLTAITCLLSHGVNKQKSVKKAWT